MKKAIKELKKKIGKGAEPFNALVAVSRKYHVSFSDLRIFAGI